MNSRTIGRVREELRALATVRRLLHNNPALPALDMALNRIEMRLRRLNPVLATDPPEAPLVVPPGPAQRREPVDPGLAVFAAMVNMGHRSPK